MDSSYLDVTLFTMFACNNIFDRAIKLPKTGNDSVEFEETQRILREEIVNPLVNPVFK